MANNNDQLYTCWGEDHEDLTSAVRAKREAGNAVFDLAVAPPKQGPSEDWRVIVTCSHGHQNIFSGGNYKAAPHASKKAKVGNASR
jgi:hypothetical protein